MPSRLLAALLALQRCSFPPPRRPRRMVRPCPRRSRSRARSSRASRRSPPSASTACPTPVIEVVLFTDNDFAGTVPPEIVVIATARSVRDLHRPVEHDRLHGQYNLIVSAFADDTIAAGAADRAVRRLRPRRDHARRGQPQLHEADGDGNERRAGRGAHGLRGRGAARRARAEGRPLRRPLRSGRHAGEQRRGAEQPRRLCQRAVPFGNNSVHC